MMEWMSNFDEEIGRWIEEIDFGNIMAEAQQIEIQHIGAIVAPPMEEATHDEARLAPLTEEAAQETGKQQPPYMEAEMDYALRALSLVQQALPLMNEAFRVRADAQDEEIAQLKQAVARLEAEKDTRPASPRVVMDNRGRDTATRVNKRPRAPRRKGTESQEEARRAHRALNAKKWRVKRKDEERQKEAGDARKRGLWWSDSTLIVLDD